MAGLGWRQTFPQHPHLTGEARKVHGGCDWCKSPVVHPGRNPRARALKPDSRESPGGPVAQDSVLSLPGPQVQFLVRELRSRRLHCGRLPTPTPHKKKNNPILHRFCFPGEDGLTGGCREHDLVFWPSLHFLSHYSPLLYAKFDLDYVSCFFLGLGP